MTEPTKYLMEVLLTDYIEQAESEGRYHRTPDRTSPKPSITR